MGRQGLLKVRAKLSWRAENERKESCSRSCANSMAVTSSPSSNDLFTDMGYDVTVTGGSNDEGVDLVAELVAGIGLQRVGIQAKCRGANREIGPNTIRLLRDALAGYECNAGAVVATCRFNDAAIAVADEYGKPQIDLIDPGRLTDLALQYGVGVRSEAIEAYSEDLESVFSDDFLES
jgi:restriction endonuclease Mrr